MCKDKSGWTAARFLLCLSMTRCSMPRCIHVQCVISPLKLLKLKMNFKGGVLFSKFITVITQPAAHYDKAWLSDREMLITGELGGFIPYLSPCKSMIPSCETRQSYKKEKPLNKRHFLCCFSPGPQRTSCGAAALSVTLHCRCNCILKKHNDSSRKSTSMHIVEVWG